MKKILIHENKKFELYIKNKDIILQTKRIAAEINRLYNGKKLLFIGILNGCEPFLNDLSNKITVPYKIDYLKISSFIGTNRGKLIFKKDIDKRVLVDKIVFIVEDIVDSGNTITYIKKYFKNNFLVKPKIISLLVKKKTKRLCDWYGFEIENKYVIGYGMDINNLFRDLNDIYILNEG